MPTHSTNPQEKELDVQNTLAERIANQETRLQHLETLESSASIPRLPRFAQENIPWIISLWPLQGNALDLGGVNGNDLVVSGPTTAQQDEFAYYQFDGTDELYDEDNASYPTGAMVAYGWGYFDTAVGTEEHWLAKWRPSTNDRAFRVFRDVTTGVIVFQISPDGTAGPIEGVVSSSIPATGVWTFWFVKFNPSTSMDIWLGINGASLEQDINTTSIPAGIFDSSERFVLGARQLAASTFTGQLTGRLTRIGLHNGLVDDATIPILYEQGLEYLGI